jgi:Putative metal-binding motif
LCTIFFNDKFLNNINMKYFLSALLLFYSFLHISCKEDKINPCDKDGDGLVSIDCGGRDCNDNDKNSLTNDQDGDGHSAIACGGFDCDDLDPTRYPGATEIYDTAGHDEDCNQTTCGGNKIDNDGDGYGLPCFNRIAGVDYWSYVGDCDDTNEAIFPGSQVCGPKGKILICTGNGAYLEAKCGTCKPQPNGTGICLD